MRDAIFLSMGISAAITATQVALQYAISKKELPSRVDVSYPNGGLVTYEGIPFTTHPGEYVIPIVDIPVRVTCDYCRTKHDYLASNCRNCGAPV